MNLAELKKAPDWATYRVEFTNGQVQTLTRDCLYYNYLMNDSNKEAVVRFETLEKFMTLDQIKKAIADGKTVHWSSDIYVVILDSLGQYFIHCTANDHYIGLVQGDGVTLNGKEDQFYCED